MDIGAGGEGMGKLCCLGGLGGCRGHGVQDISGVMEGN